MLQLATIFPTEIRGSKAWKIRGPAVSQEIALHDLITTGYDRSILYCTGEGTPPMQPDCCGCRSNPLTASVCVFPLSVL
jgi:hypothetical protein